MRFNSRVSDWLTLGLRGDSRKTRYNGTRESVLSLSPELGAAVYLPLGARLTLSGMFGFERRDVERVEGAAIPVLNEEHTDWVWADRAWIQNHWNDLHPGLREILTRFQEKTAKGNSGNLLQRFCRETPGAGALDAESLALLFLGADG